MDEKLRDSLMEWYLRYGCNLVSTEGRLHEHEFQSLKLAWCSSYIKLAWCSSYIKGVGLPDYHYKITPEGIEALKNG